MAQNQGTQTDVGLSPSPSTSLLVFLGQEGELSTQELDDRLPCSYATTRRHLLRLVDMGAVERNTSSRTHNWCLNTSVSDHQSDPEGDFEPDQVASLVTETVAELAAQLDDQHKDSTLPTAVSGWLRDRNISEDISKTEYAYRIAVYRRLLRSLLYQLHYPEHEEQLSSLSPGAQWPEKFEEALHLTHDVGLASTNVDSLAESPGVWLNSIILSVQKPLMSCQNPATILARVYESLVSQEARRDLGQFATPPYVAEFLASWAVDENSDTILDPGIGAGQLASQALRRKLKAGANNPISDIIGVDVDETAIAMAAVTLKLVDGDGSAELVQKDFIEYSPRVYTDDEYQIKTADGVIANPPYSRHQSVDEERKQRLNEIIAAESDYEFDLRTPLYGYFLVHAAQFLKDGGKLAAIVPSKFLDTEFGRDLKRFLLDEFRIQGILQLEDSIDIFSGVRTQPAILLLEKGTAKEDQLTRILRLNTWPENSDSTKILSDATESSSVGESTVIAQRLLSPTERWSHYLEEDDLLNRAEMSTFEEIANVSRGIATGDNDYFCLTASEVDEYGISEEYLQPIIRSAHGLRTIDITKDDWKNWRDNNRPVWLLYCYDEEGNVLEKEQIDDEAVLEYLAEGEASDTTDGYLVSKRNPWYRVEDQSPAPILAKYMNRTGFLFMRNHPELRSLNNVHVISPIKNYSEEEIEALLAYLNSRIVSKHLSKYSLDYQGLQKLEINQLNNVPVIEPRELDDDTISALSELYERLRKARRRDRDDETILDEIQRELEPVLQWEDENRT